MNLRMRDGYRLMALAALWMTALTIQAAEAVYRIVEYNKTTGEFELAASGMVPKGSWAYFGHSCISPWQYNHVIQRS